MSVVMVDTWYMEREVVGVGVPTLSGGLDRVMIHEAVELIRELPGCFVQHKNLDKTHSSQGDQLQNGTGLKIWVATSSTG